MPNRPAKTGMRRPHWARGQPPDHQPLQRQKDPDAVRAVHDITERYKELRRRGARLPRPNRFYGTPAELIHQLDEAEAELNNRRQPPA